MKPTLKFLFLVGITAMVAGCKLAVIVVEGGEVQSSSSGICIASSICIVDVNDPNFSETFTAVPFAGWYFEKWNSGDRFLCGDYIDPECTLSFEGYEESEAVQEMVNSSEMFYLMPVFKPYQHTITVNGMEWLQPALFKDLSWNDIIAVCSAETGECSGVLNGQDITGWTWASVDDVNALFNFYIGREELGPGEDYYQELESEWLPAFLDDGWHGHASGNYLQALSRESFNVEGFDEAYAPEIGRFGVLPWVPGPGADFVNTGFDLNVDETGGGVWLYRKL